MKILILISLLASIVFASIGQVTGIKGKATLLRETKSSILTIGFKLEKSDIIKTGEKAKVQIIFEDKTIVTIGKKSTLDIEEYLFDEAAPSKSKVKLKFFRGAFKSITGKIGKVAPSRFKLKTKNATIGIRGTVLAGNQNRVICERGAITVTSQGVTQVVPAGMMTITAVGAPPTPAVAFKAGSISLEDEAEQEEKKEKEKVKKEEKKKEKVKKEDKKDKKSEQKQKSKASTKKSDNKEVQEEQKQETVVENTNAPKPASEEAPVATPQATQTPVKAPKLVVPVDTPPLNIEPVAVPDPVIPQVPIIPDDDLKPLDKDLPDVLAHGGGETDPNAKPGETPEEEAKRIAAEEEAAKIAAEEEAAKIAAEEEAAKIAAEEEAAKIAAEEEAAKIAAEEEAAKIAAEEEAAKIAAEEEAAKIAAEEEAAKIAAEEEAAKIAADEAAAKIAAEEEAAALLAQQEAAAAAAGAAQAAAIAEGEKLLSTFTIPNSSTVSTTTSASNSYLEYGTWDDSTVTGAVDGLYIVGSITPADVVAQVQPNQTYSGTLAGLKTVNSVASGQVAGTIDLNINYAAQTLTGNIGILDGTQQWNASIASGAISKYGFASTDISGTVYDSSISANTSTNVTGLVQGDFYGTAAQSVGGTFKLEDNVVSSPTVIKGVYGTPIQQP